LACFYHTVMTNQYVTSSGKTCPEKNTASRPKVKRQRPKGYFIVDPWTISC
jgi:hypothetical protein